MVCVKETPGHSLRGRAIKVSNYWPIRVQIPPPRAAFSWHLKRGWFWGAVNSSASSVKSELSKLIVSRKSKWRSQVSKDVLPHEKRYCQCATCSVQVARATRFPGQVRDSPSSSSCGADAAADVSSNFHRPVTVAAL